MKRGKIALIEEGNYDVALIISKTPAETSYLIVPITHKSALQI